MTKKEEVLQNLSTSIQMINDKEVLELASQDLEIQNMIVNLGNAYIDAGREYPLPTFQPDALACHKNLAE